MSKWHNITNLVHAAGFNLKKASPTILTVTGVGALIASAVLAAKKTPEMAPVVEKLADDTDKVAKAEQEGSLDIHAINKARYEVYGEFVGGFIRVYGLPIALAVGGTVAILSAHGIMKRREASLIAAYGVLERAYSAYRDRVRESFGEEAEENLYSGKTIRIDGVDKKEKTVSYSTTEPEVDKSDYIAFFTPDNKHFNVSRPEWNLTFLRAQEHHANRMLTIKGHVMLNEVLEGLGFPATPAGAVTGWIKNFPGGDERIDFDLPEQGSPEEQDLYYFWTSGDGDSIRLDFNVHGLIWDKIGKKF